jgi:hypothetical protein
MEEKHFTGKKEINEENNIKSIFTSEAQTWTLKQKHKNKLLTTEMGYWR